MGVLVMYNINIREEIFGGTLFNLETGKREYINKKELKNILEMDLFPDDIAVVDNKHPINIKFVKLDEANANINHFSFADIVFLELTRQCNLSCKHCLNDSGERIPNQLSTVELVELIKSLAQAGVQDIRFTGGEPLLFEDVYKLISLATECGIYTSLGTNGTIITDDVAKRLKSSGLKKAVVSIDGTEEKHNFIRGAGSFQKTIKGIENLLSQGVRVRVNSVIMRSNMEEVIALAKELHKKKVPIFIRRFLEAGRGIELENNMLSKEDYQYVKEQLKEELKGKYVIGHYLNDNMGIIPRIPLPFKLQGCKAGQRAIAIMANGDIQLCGFLCTQGVAPINNVRNIDNWKVFWDELQENKTLDVLRCNLDRYNKIPGIQETYCLAYIQRWMNKQKMENKEELKC